MQEKNLQTAVVTGAGGGIGRAVAHRLAEDGFRVVVVDRIEATARETLAELKTRGFDAYTEVIDLTDETAARAMIDRVDNLQVLVNNAGIFTVIPFDKLTSDDFRSMYEVNFIPMFNLCQQAARKMPKWGRIINMSSRAAYGARNYAHYAASKAAVAGFTKSLALELSEKRITVNGIAPGVIQTDLIKQRPDLSSLRDLQPLGELGIPEDVANAVAFFADRRSSYVTGQVLIVDGGRGLAAATTF